MEVWDIEMDQGVRRYLLLHYLGVRNGRAEVTGLEEFSDSDWNELCHEVFRHEVASLLYHRFRTTDIDIHVPMEIMQTLQEIY